MHPILHNRKRLLLYLLAWAPVAGFITWVLAQDNRLSFLEASVVAFPVCTAYAFVCLSTWYICRAIPLREGNLFRLLLTFVIAGLAAAAAWLLALRAWVSLLDGLWILPGVAGRFAGQPESAGLALLLFLLAAAAHYLLLVSEESRLAEKQALELQVFAREAELKALRAQVNPHFLFNSLNSISALTSRDPSAARRMCLLLADFLRQSLQLGAKETIPFQEELMLAESFLDIEKVRFGERLNFEVDADPECLSCMTPPLLIQPLVENAVTHGVAALVNGGAIRIEARRRGSRLEIAVENPFQEQQGQRAGAGIGLKNVRDRLARMFGGEARVDVEYATERFRVIIRMPCAS